MLFNPELHIQQVVLKNTNAQNPVTDSALTGMDLPRGIPTCNKGHHWLKKWRSPYLTSIWQRLQRTSNPVHRGHCLVSGRSWTRARQQHTREASTWPGDMKFYVKEAHIFTGLQQLQKKKIKGKRGRKHRSELRDWGFRESEVHGGHHTSKKILLVAIAYTLV